MKKKVKHQKGIKNKLSWFEIVLRIFACTLAVAILFPFIYLILSSLKTVDEYYATKFILFPHDPQWGRYKELFVDFKFYRYIINSIVLATISVCANLVASSLVSYGISRFKFKGRGLLFTLILVTIFLPAQVTSIPKFIIWYKVKMLNTFVPLVLPSLFGASSSILLISSFMKGVPKEMDEAAMIDGCNRFKIWWKVILPQTIPVLCVVALNGFIGSWKSSMGPMIYLRDERLYTVPIALLYFQSPSPSSYLYLMAGVVISIVPTTILFMYGQKWFDKGVSVGTLK